MSPEIWKVTKEYFKPTSQNNKGMNGWVHDAIRSDQIGLDQIGLDQIGLDQIR